MENSVHRKPFKEKSKILELTIELYLCYDEH